MSGAKGSRLLKKGKCPTAAASPAEKVYDGWQLKGYHQRFIFCSSSQ
jgi:hypothetical protein